MGQNQVFVCMMNLILHASKKFLIGLMTNTQLVIVFKISNIIFDCHSYQMKLHNTQKLKFLYVISVGKHQFCLVLKDVNCYMWSNFQKRTWHSVAMVSSEE